MRNPVFLILCLMLMAACAPKQSGHDDNASQTTLLSDAKVHVVYFHGKQRCKSCLAIQQVASETVAEVYSGNPDVEFVEIDFSDKANEAIAEKYEVAWSSLFIISGGQHNNLTNEAFAIALKDQEALKELITTEVDIFLHQ